MVVQTWLAFLVEEVRVRDIAAVEFHVDATRWHMSAGGRSASGGRTDVKSTGDATGDTAGRSRATKPDYLSVRCN